MKTVQVYATGARTATPTAVTVNAGRYNWLRVVIDVTAVTATPSVVLTIDGYDPVSGKYYNLLTAAAVTATGTTELLVGPGLTIAANVVANKPLPDTIRFTMTHGDADSITYTLAAHLMD
jgi:hypothetical protein